MEMLSDFYAAYPFWVWLGVAALFLAAEVMSGSGWLLWPTGAAAIVALLTFVLPDSLWLEVAIFAGLTLVTSLLGRRFMPRSVMAGPDINDNITRLVGQRGEAAVAFTGGRGRVLVDGKEWDAEADGDIAPGERIEVVTVLGGARLKVRGA